MSAFLAAAFAFPTVVFTVALLFFIAYAVLSMVGAFSLTSLDGILGIDIADVTPEESLLDGAMNSFGVGGIPLTIFGGVSAIFAWLASFTAMHFFGNSLPGGVVGTATASLLGAGSALFGLFIGSRLVKPLKPIFVTVPAPGRQSLVGKLCTIRSLRVDRESGTAEIEDGGAGFVAEVRCYRENNLTRGSRAVVWEYDSAEGIYKVAPVDAIYAENETATSTKQAVNQS
jgi:hypothetical protein